MVISWMWLGHGHGYLMITDISWLPHGDGSFPDRHYLILSDISLLWTCHGHSSFMVISLPSHGHDDFMSMVILWSPVGHSHHILKVSSNSWSSLCNGHLMTMADSWPQSGSSNAHGHLMIIPWSIHVCNHLMVISWLWLCHGHDYLVVTVIS